MNWCRKIVLTGGPSGGKTTVTEAVSREFPDQVQIVPEAASLIFSGGWPRRANANGIRRHQRAIYFVQRELEEMIQSELTPTQMVLCDRGSMDGVAYWPFEDGGFLKELESDESRELKRYDLVLHLDTAPVSAYSKNNRVRNESFEEAWALNEKIKQAWSGHPHRIIIPGLESGFIDKLSQSLLVIEMCLQNKSFLEIQAQIKSG